MIYLVAGRILNPFFNSLLDSAYMRLPSHADEEKIFSIPCWILRYALGVISLYYYYSFSIPCWILHPRSSYKYVSKWRVFNSLLDSAVKSCNMGAGSIFTFSIPCWILRLENFCCGREGVVVFNSLLDSAYGKYILYCCRVGFSIPCWILLRTSFSACRTPSVAFSIPCWILRPCCVNSLCGAITIFNSLLDSAYVSSCCWQQVYPHFQFLVGFCIWSSAVVCAISSIFNSLLDSADGLYTGYICVGEVLFVVVGGFPWGWFLFPRYALL